MAFPAVAITTTAMTMTTITTVIKTAIITMVITMIAKVMTRVETTTTSEADRRHALDRRFKYGQPTPHIQCLKSTTSSPPVQLTFAAPPGAAFLRRAERLLSRLSPDVR